MATPKEQVRVLHPGMAIFSAPSAGRGLHPGDCIKMFDGTFHFIQYVNSSGAYAVPLASITRTIAGHTANFTAGGRTISATAIVEVINPLSMGGNSAEYQRYVKMVSASREAGMAKKKGTTATSATVIFDEFDETDPTDGHTVVAMLANGPTKKEVKDMAKKAAAPKAAQKVKAAKAPKTVRNCACGCPTETTGNFAPGHDARLHGLIKKLADGRMEPKEYAYPATIKKLGLVKTQAGYKATHPHFYQD